jgi:anthranilate/para-aminobenzoate synthase component II
VSELGFASLTSLPRVTGKIRQLEEHLYLYFSGIDSRFLHLRYHILISQDMPPRQQRRTHVKRQELQSPQMDLS